MKFVSNRGGGEEMMRGWTMRMPKYKLGLVLEMKCKAAPITTLGLACDIRADEMRGCR